MTKNAALQTFMESFGLQAFPAASVPTSGDEKPGFPYLTYSAYLDSDFGVSRTLVSLWYRGESWLDVNAKADEISAAIQKGYMVPCDGGGMIIRKGFPFSQQMGDESDSMIKRRLLSLDITFVTTF